MTLKNRIAKLPRIFQRLCSQRFPNAFLGKVRLMKSKMDEPCPIVIPQMMVQVAWIDADAEFVGHDAPP